jgi:reactive intermediate/imine deaminase
MQKQIIHTDNAPKAIGCYSQAVKIGNTVYLSGQIGLCPDKMELVDGIDAQVEQVFKNLTAVVEASGANLSHIIKINIYLTDMVNFSVINNMMAKYFIEPYPARAVVGVKELPKGALVEADAVLVV